MKPIVAIMTAMNVPMQVQAQKDADARHEMKELHGRHASLRHSLQALHSAYRQLRLRLEDLVSTPRSSLLDRSCSHCSCTTCDCTDCMHMQWTNDADGEGGKGRRLGGS